MLVVRVSGKMREKKRWPTIAAVARDRHFAGWEPGRHRGYDGDRAARPGSVGGFQFCRRPVRPRRGSGGVGCAAILMLKWFSTEGRDVIVALNPLRGCVVKQCIERPKDEGDRLLRQRVRHRRRAAAPAARWGDDRPRSAHSRSAHRPEPDEWRPTCAGARRRPLQLTQSLRQDIGAPTPGSPRAGQ